MGGWRDQKFTDLFLSLKHSNTDITVNKNVLSMLFNKE